jgi:hypothetical protein
VDHLAFRRRERRAGRSFLGDASELGSSPLGPESCAEPAEDHDRGFERLAGAGLLARPTSDLPRGQQRATAHVRHPRPVGQLDAVVSGGDGPVDVAFRCQQERVGACRLGIDPADARSAQPADPGLEQRSCVVGTADGDAGWVPALPAARGLPRLDAAALVLWSLGVFAVVYGVVAFATGWGGGGEIALAGGAVALAIGIWRLSHARGSDLQLPRVPFRIIGVALITGSVVGFAQSGLLLQLTTFLEGVQRSGSGTLVLAPLPFVVAIVVASLASGVMLARRHRAGTVDLGVYRRPMVGGLLLVVAAMMVFSTLRPESPYLVIGIGLVALAIGASFANVPRTNLLFRSVHAGRVGTVAGLNGSALLLGTALGNISVTVAIAISSAARWQAIMVGAGLSQEDAASLYAAAQRAIFLFTAHPYLQPSYLDIASRLPGFAQIFTDAFVSASVALGLVALAGAAVAFLGLRAWDANGRGS